MSRTFKDAPNWVQAHRGFKRPSNRHTKIQPDPSIQYHHRPERIGEAIMTWGYLFNDDGVKENYCDLNADERDDVVRSLQERGFSYDVFIQVPRRWSHDQVVCYVVTPYVKKKHKKRFAPRCTCGEALVGTRYIDGVLYYMTVDGFVAPCEPENTRPYGAEYFGSLGRKGRKCHCCYCRAEMDNHGRFIRARASANCRVAVRELDGDEDALYDAIDRLTYDAPYDGYWC